MKTAKLKNGLICVSVPMDATEFYVSLTYTKYILYQKDNHSNSVELPFRNLNNYQILGTITANECSFDLALFCDDVKECNCNDCFVYVKSMIEAETEFLFSNPYKKPNLRDMLFFEGTDDFEKWEQSENKIIEKLLILKTI